MKTIDQVLEDVPDHLAAADELVRRFSSDDSALREAAQRWIDRASKAGEAAPLVNGEERAVRHAHRLVEQATTGTEPLHDWALRARRKRYRWGLGDSREEYDLALLNVAIWVWPHRMEKAAWPVRLEAWGRLVAQPCSNCTARGQRCASGAHAPLQAALALADYPDLAYRMVAPAMADRRLAGDALAVCLALERMARPGLVEPRDQECIDDFGARRIMSDLLSLPALLRVVREGKRELSWLWSSVETALGIEDEWPVAVAILCADRQHQDRAVAVLASAVQGSADPLAPLERAIRGRPLTLSGIALLTGPGWGRERLASKLKPLTRALVARRVWPVDLIREALPPQAADAEHADQAFETMRDVLAEACLSIARDSSEALAPRELALDALERLSPRNESFVRALSKLKDVGSIWDRARRAQKGLQCGEEVDAELAVADACEMLDIAVVRHPR
jgi:hypothetical protein